MTKTPAERLIEVEHRVFVLQILVGFALAVEVAGFLAAFKLHQGDSPHAESSDTPPWRAGPEGEIVFAGEVRAARFVVMQANGGRGVVLGDPGGDSGPGLHVYAEDGQQPVAAMWRESFAGRSRLRIGDVDARPIEVIGNSPGALLVAPALVTHAEPIVRSPTE